MAIRFFSRRFAFAGVVLAVCAMAGCSRSSESGGVVASVNGHSLTAAELEARAVNIATLSCHRAGKKNGKSQKQRFEKICGIFRKGYPKIWVEDRVLQDFAAANGLEVSPSLLKQFQNGALRNFGGKGEKYADLVALEGMNVDFWEDQVRADALRHVVERHWAKLYPTNLPPTYADDMIAKMEARNRAMTVTNALVYAKATNVWEKLKAGADFVKMVKEFSEIKEEVEDDGEWAIVDDKFLADDPKLLRTLRAMKPGEFSPPVEGDNGLMIARLDRYESDDGLAVSRIFFHLPIFLTPAPKDEIVKVALTKYAKALFREKLSELVSAAKATYVEVSSKENERKGKKK